MSISSFVFNLLIHPRSKHEGIRCTNTDASAFVTPGILRSVCDEDFELRPSLSPLVGFEVPITENPSLPG